MHDHVRVEIQQPLHHLSEQPPSYRANSRDHHKALRILDILSRKVHTDIHYTHYMLKIRDIHTYMQIAATRWSCSPGRARMPVH